MKAHLRYLRYVLSHKWFVLMAGLRIGGIPLWRLLIHDWSKLTPAEWGPYVRYFYGTRPTERLADRDGGEFDRARLHHQHRNPHHWQHWVLREDSGAVKLLRMPEHFAREMVADWMGAGRAMTGRWEAREWYEKNGDNMQLAMFTRVLAERLLGVPCYCGAFGASKECCDHFGYCQAHFTSVEAQGGRAARPTGAPSEE